MKRAWCSDAALHVAAEGVLQQDISFRSKSYANCVIHSRLGSKGRRRMETRILIGYGLFGCVALSILAWILTLALGRWRTHQRRKQLWKRYYK